MKQTKPFDKVYLVMVVFGISSYLPFFSVLGSHNYWVHFYDITFTTIATTVLNCGETVGVLLSIPILRKRPLRFCVELGYAMNLFCMLVLPLFRYVSDYYTRYAITFLPITFLGLAAGFVFTAFNNIAAQIDKRYAQAVQLGTGSSEVIVYILKIALAYTADSFSGMDYENQLFVQTLIYFILAIVYVIASWVVWIFFRKQFAFVATCITSSAKEHTMMYEVLINNDEQAALEDPIDPPKSGLSRKVKVLSAAIFVNYFITYLLFPALTTSIPSVTLMQNGKNPIDPWFSLWMMTVYMFSDFFGRMSAKLRFIQDKVGYISIIVLSYIRLIHIPLLFLINLPRPGKQQTYAVIHADWFSFVLVAIFSYSGGLNVPILFMRAYDGLTSYKEKHDASNFITSFFSAGCTISGFFSIAVAYLVKD